MDDDFNFHACIHRLSDDIFPCFRFFAKPGASPEGRMG